MTGPLNGDDLLAKIKPQLKEVRVEVCLRPDLTDQWHDIDDALKTELAKSAGAAGGRLNSTADGIANASPAAKRLARKQQTLEKEIEGASIWFTFRALTVAEYQELCTEHPPRKDMQFDIIRGYNIQAVSEALVRRCLVDPEFTDEGWANLRAALGPSEWAALVSGADEANGGTTAPPKSELASRILAKRGNASE